MPDDNEMRHRRLRLRELIAKCFNGQQRALLDFVEKKTGKRPNQGEMSGLVKFNGKSFGDKKARALAEAIGLHRRWFDLPLGSNLLPSEWAPETTEPPPQSSGQAQQPIKDYSPTDPAIQDVITIMKLVNHDYRQQILGNAKMLLAEFRMKNPTQGSS